MTYIINLDGYKLRPGDEKAFSNFMDEKTFIIHKYICMLMLKIVYECIFLCAHILTCKFIIEIVQSLLNFTTTTTTTLHVGVL